MKIELYEEFKAYATRMKHSFPITNSDHDVGKWMSERPINVSRYFKFLDDRTAKKYLYLITFTLRDPLNSDKAEEYIRDQVNRSHLDLTRWIMAKEHTKKGVPHWHCAVEARKPIKKNRFQYYEKLYGFIDVSRTKGQTLDEALQYISKESVPEILL